MLYLSDVCPSASIMGWSPHWLYSTNLLWKLETGSDQRSQTSTENNAATQLIQWKDIS